MADASWTNEELHMVRKRAHALYVQGRLREAAILLEGLVAIDPKDRYSRDALGSVYLGLDEPGRALEQFDRAVQLDPNDFQARARRCEVLIRTGDTPEALSELQILKRILPATEIRRLQWRLEAAIKAQ
jgi:predicted Zn-dependent protease